jgi:hypothetical protein
MLIFSSSQFVRVAAKSFVGPIVADQCRTNQEQHLMRPNVISRRRSNSVAFEAKRTFSAPRLQYKIYENTA